MPAAAMAARADRVIVTDGAYAETGLQVLEGWADLRLPVPAPGVRRGELADAEGIAAVLNAVVREGGRTAIDRTYTPAQERAFLRRLPERARLIVATLGTTVAGFQVLEPYADYTGAMDHVATIGTYVAPPAQRCGLGAAMSIVSFDAARAAGFRKLVAGIRSDNAGGLAFYKGLGFRACGRLAEQVAVGDDRVDQLLFERFL
jgi:L-amino acid N-acyltransferase YncA